MLLSRKDIDIYLQYLPPRNLTTAQSHPSVLPTHLSLYSGKNAIQLALENCNIDIANMLFNHGYNQNKRCSKDYTLSAKKYKNA